jgi:PAS domain S-box-containing protein
MKGFFSGLRIRLMLLVLLAVVPALALILSSGLEQRRQAIANAENQAFQFLMHVSLYQDRLMAGTVQLLDTLAQLPQLREWDAERCSEIFASILRKHVQYSNIGAAGIDGYVFASGTQPGKPVTVVDREYFQRVLRRNGLVISDYLISRVTGVPSLVSAYPIHDASGIIQGVVWATMDVNSLATITAREPLPSNSVITITDSWGTVLYTNQRSEELVGKPFPNAASIGMACSQGKGMLHVRGPNGESLLHVFHPISSVAPVGYIFVELDQKSILVGPDRLLRRNIIGLSAAAVFAILASWLFGAALVTEKMRSLGEAARRLSEGDLTVRTGMGGGKGEIDQLAASFDKMAEALQQRDFQRRRAEAALQASEEKYRLIVETANEGIWVVDERYITTFVNSVMAAMIGYEPGEILGRPFTDFIFLEDNPAYAQAILQRSQGQSGGYERRLRHKDGRDVWTLVSATPMFDCNHEFIGSCGMFTDITERKRMEMDLVKVEKLESLGVLAGGIAHDFNNILTAIVGNISLAKMFAKPDDPILKRLDDAENASMRAKDLTFQLLTFSKGGAPVREIVSLREIIAETCEFCLRGANVKCYFDLPGDLWLVNADSGQISQVIHNITINAKQAMPDGGVVRVSARNMPVDTGSRLPVSPGLYVRISIEDHGGGIAAEHLSKIFDPYFTTKKNGTGLGLASSYSIVHKHDGYIAAESQPGVGTAFHIYLPATLKKTVGLNRPEESSSTLHGKILLVDDEEQIREVAGAMLARLGYESVCAAEGSSAIELFRKARDEGAPFAAVILDLTIPGGMGGKETIKHLVQIDAAVKAIVSSGYSNDPVMAQYQEYGFCGVVSKPYRMKDLGEVLKKALGSA